MIARTVKNSSIMLRRKKNRNRYENLKR